MNTRTRLVACFLMMFFSLAIALPQLLASIPCHQEATGEPQDEAKLATIRGNLVLNSDQVATLDWDSFQGSLGQLVALRQPQVPEDWQSRTPQQREQWLKEFYESEAGKQLLAENQEKLKNRHLQDFKIRGEGKFVIYDVPQGLFELRIQAEVTESEKTWLVQAFGRFQVGEVDELDFSELPLEVLRLLASGEPAPEITGTSTSGEAIKLSDLRGKYVLLTFAATADPNFKATTQMLKDASQSEESRDKLTLLTVTVDEDLDAVATFNKENGVAWPCLNLGNWDQATMTSYGLKSVPSFWLIDPSGKVALTGAESLLQLNRNRISIAKLVDDAIAGRLVWDDDNPDETPESGAGEAFEPPAADNSGDDGDDDSDQRGH